MSTMILSKCWPLQMPPTPKSVLISLADNANDQGDCWPSIPTISMRTCFSERAVRTSILWLEQHHLLIADRSNGRHTRYLLTPDSYQETLAADAGVIENQDEETPADAAQETGKPRQEMHPGSSCTPAAPAPTPAGGAALPRQLPHKPRQEVPPNHQEPSLEPSRNHHKDEPEFSASAALKKLGVEKQIAKDWLELRKKKKAPVTQTALDGIVKEAGIAGMTVNDALRMGCERAWVGFKAEWTQSARGLQRHGTPNQPQLDDENQRAFEMIYGKKQSEVIDG